MSSEKINIGLIGCGYWGKNILRNITEQPLSGNITVCDTSAVRIASVKSNLVPINTTQDSQDLLNNDQIKAIIIATPTSTHYKIAREALLKGKHVLVEKPLSTSLEQTEELIAIATAHNLVLMVDHIFLYNPVVRQLKKYITPEFIGKINYIDATRINLGIYQNDTNVLWDLACHDISIINFLTEEKPESVRAIGRINPSFGVEDVAYLFLYYQSGLLVQINSSWASPVKMRKMIIGGDKKMIIYDDIEATNKLIIYDYEHSTTDNENKSKLVDYRLGDITIPKYEISEALKNVISEFYDCILSGERPIADGKNAADVIKILESAQESLRLNGAIISLN